MLRFEVLRYIMGENSKRAEGQQEVIVMTERIIGIDFGTSTSVIRVKRYENGRSIGEALETKAVMFGGSGATVPTLIMKKDDDASVAYYGHEAQQKKRNYTNYHSFKVDLESDDREKRARARELTEEFFAFMGKQYRAQSDGGHLGSADDKEHTIISYPVKWSEETKRFMIATAKKAGFPNVTGMDEAQAAIHAVTVMSSDYLLKHGLLQNGVASNILLIDMGAGTTDLVLCRYTPGETSKTELLVTWPKRGKILFGGKEIDILLKNFFWDKMDEADAELVFKRIGTDKFKTWKEESVSPALRENDSVSDFEVLDSCAEMMEIDVDEYCLNRAEFEKCLEVYLTQLPVLINDCVNNSGIPGKNVDLVIVTGGHSQWYFVHDILSGKMSKFGNVDLPRIKENPSRIVPISRPQETVALGLVYSLMQNEIPTVGPQTTNPVVEDRKSVDAQESKNEDEAAAQRQLAEGSAWEEEFRLEQESAQKATQKTVYTPESEFELGSIGSDYVIRKYIGNRKIVSIPPVIHGRKVVAIGMQAFVNVDVGWFLKDLSTIEKVIIPETVTVIGFAAFSYCTKLHTVIAHSKIQNIGILAFAGCNHLTILDFGWKTCKAHTLIIPPSVKKIGYNAFSPKDKGGAVIKGAIFKEVHLSRKTKVSNIMFNPKTFDPNYCSVFYYD